ncbi:MAG: hypothetical protein UE116_06425 [Clostridia bacterium]|jgi:hypothetical protein|nr:hypothetical protein [Clostridia bacterium]
MNDLPPGWKKNKDGLWEYTMFPEEVKEMNKQFIRTFMLAILNIIQALFIIILVLSNFCNH